VASEGWPGKMTVRKSDDSAARLPPVGMRNPVGAIYHLLHEPSVPLLLLVRGFYASAGDSAPNPQSFSALLTRYSWCLEFPPPPPVPSPKVFLLVLGESRTGGHGPSPDGPNAQRGLSWVPCLT